MRVYLNVFYGAFVYRLVPQIFILVRAVRFCHALRMVKADRGSAKPLARIHECAQVDSLVCLWVM